MEFDLGDCLIETKTNNKKKANKHKNNNKNTNKTLPQKLMWDKLKMPITEYYFDFRNLVQVTFGIEFWYHLSYFSKSDEF